LREKRRGVESEYGKEIEKERKRERVERENGGESFGEGAAGGHSTVV